MAFLPARIVLDGPNQTSNYVSNGFQKLPLSMHVQDQAGNDVTSGSLCLSNRHGCACMHFTLYQVAAGHRWCLQAAAPAVLTVLATALAFACFPLVCHNNPSCVHGEDAAQGFVYHMLNAQLSGIQP